MQPQAEGIGHEAVTDQAVGAETVLELLDAILTLAAIILESEDLRGTTGAVGNHKAEIASGGGVLGLVADAARCGRGGGNWRSCAAALGCGDSAARLVFSIPIAADITFLNP